MREKNEDKNEIVKGNRKEEKVKSEILESAIEAYKKSTRDLRWSLTLLASVFLLFTGYLLFRDRQEYKDATKKAEEAAKEAAETAREVVKWKEKVEEQFKIIDNKVARKLKEIEEKGEEQFGKIDKEVAANLKEIKERGEDAIAWLIEYGERLQRISYLWSKGSQALNEGNYRISAEYWEEILEIDPENAFVLENWAISLAVIGEKEVGVEADKYFERAYEKYKEALDIDPNGWHTLVSWGQSFVEHAKKKDRKEADKYFVEAYGQYEKALSIKPQYYDAWWRWGLALLEQARRKEGDEAERLLEESYKKFKRTTDIEPDNKLALGAWGNALCEHALRKDGLKAEELYEKAYEKYEKVLSINPNDYYALANWGRALGYHASAKEGKEAEKLITQACNKFLKAFTIYPHRYEALHGWGCVLLHLASIKSEENQTDEAKMLMNRACSKLEMAANREANSRCFRALGNAFDLKTVGKKLRVWGKKVKTTEELLDQACEKYEMAVALDPDDYLTLERWARILLFRAMHEKGKSRESILEQAKKKCLSAERIKRGASAYTLACISAALGDENECKRRLKLGEELVTLPPEHVVKKEGFLKGMRNKRWFKGIRWKEE